MPPKRDPRRDQARALFLESGGKKKLRTIAGELGVNEKTVSAWKCKDQWDAILRQNYRNGVLRKGGSGVLQKTKAGKTAKHVSRLGNQNAAGPHPSESYKGLKNALTTGQYEKIKYETMTEEERALIAATDHDKTVMQRRLIDELEVRELRMYRRIRDLQDMAGKELLVPDSLTTEGNKARKERRLVFDKINDIEHALTAIQRQKQAAIDALHRMQRDGEALDMDRQKIDLLKQRLELQRERPVLPAGAALRGEGVRSGADIDGDGVRQRMSEMSDEELGQYERLCAMFDNGGDET